MVLVAAPKEATENEAEDDEQVEAGTEAEASTGAQSLPNLFVHIVDKYAGTKSYLLLILRFSPYLHTYMYMYVCVSVRHWITETHPLHNSVGKLL